MTLPASVTAAIQNPLIEDFAAPVLRQAYSDLTVWTLVPEDFGTDFQSGVLVRKGVGPGMNNSDPRGFTEEAWLVLDCFAKDPDGDYYAGQLAEAVRVAFRDAWLNQTVINNTWIARFNMPDEPARKPDFADSAGPVQYANLPQGFWRYQLKLDLIVRHGQSADFS